LPDGIFSNQKSQLGEIVDVLAMEDVGIFYGHLACFTANFYILLPFGMFNGYLVPILFPVLVCCTEKKSGNPGVL
jgi:hypothetical protein